MNKIIALLPARCGSKGISLKNIYPINHRPMISYGITAAKNSIVDDIYVSTDCAEIARVSQEYGATIIQRPPEISTDSSPTIECVKHCISYLKLQNEDIIVLIQPTSPMIQPNDITNGIDTFNLGSHSIIISVSENHSILWEEHNNSLVPKGHDPKYRTQRQNMGKIFSENGAFYIFKVNNIIEYDSIYGYGKVGYVTIPKSRSFDIDDYEDVKIVEALLNE